jgi:hypothetical protein
LPEDVEYEKLEEKDGQLVAPYVTELDVSALEPPDWVKDYSGALPQGMRITLSRARTDSGIRDYLNSDVEERVEYVFGFPQ